MNRNLCPEFKLLNVVKMLELLWDFLCQDYKMKLDKLPINSGQKIQLVCLYIIIYDEICMIVGM